MRLGIIDIGSNSIRLVIVDINNSAFTVLNQIKYSARLAKNMSNDGFLDIKQINIALDSLSYFKEYSTFHNVEELIIVATEAVRKAKNRDLFLSQAKKIFGYDIRVLSGQEECYYDYLATVNTLDIKNALIFDLGGASTELILIKDRKILESTSIPIGAINLTEKFNLNKNVTEEKLKALNDYILSLLKEVPWLYKNQNIHLIGIGGSSRTIGKIDRYIKNQGAFIAHNYSVTSNDVKSILNQTKDYMINKGKKVPGLTKDREDIFIASISVVDILLKIVKSNRMFVSGAGLRDGLLYEYLYGANKLVPDVLEFSLENIIKQHLPEYYDGAYTWKIVEMLFNKLCYGNITLSSNKKSLKTATYLYDLGNNINYYQKDRNTFYSILNAPINGLNQKQILMAASIATVYNSDDILKEYLNKKILSTKDLIIIEKLGLLLKVGKAITYGLTSEIKILSVDIIDKNFLIKIKTKNKLLFLNEQLNFIKYDFKRVFKLNLEVEVTTSNN